MTLMPRFADENFAKNQVLVARVLAKGEDLVSIPGTKRRKYLEENAAAADIRLSAAEVAELEAAVPQSDIAGDRYSAGAMNAIDREPRPGPKPFRGGTSPVWQARLPERSLHQRRATVPLSPDG